MCGNDATRVGRWNKTPKASLPAVESKFCRSRVPNSLSVYYYTVSHVDFAIMMWISVQSGAPDAVHRFGLIRFGHNDRATKFVEPRIAANNHSVRILLKLICINKAAVSGAAGGYRSSSALPEPGDAPSIFRRLILCSFAFAREGGGRLRRTCQDRRKSLGARHGAPHWRNDSVGAPPPESLPPWAGTRASRHSGRERHRGISLVFQVQRIMETGRQRLAPGRGTGHALAGGTEAELGQHAARCGVVGEVPSPESCDG